LPRDDPLHAVPAASHPPTATATLFQHTGFCTCRELVVHSKDESDLRESSKTTARTFWGILPLQIHELIRKGVHLGALKRIPRLYRRCNNVPMLPASTSKVQNPPSNPTNTCALQREERERNNDLRVCPRIDRRSEGAKQTCRAHRCSSRAVQRPEKNNALTRAARDLCIVTKNKGEKLCSSASTGETTQSHTKLGNCAPTKER
jgi:hypothetical protein